jgi:IS30 family transposase
LYKQLTGKDRDLIALLKGERWSNKNIAEKLGKDVSTIGREVRRNSFKGRHYVAIHAHTKSEKRKAKARARHPLKDPGTYSHVVDKIGLGWSPELIAGRLKKKHGKTVICSESIYSFIYSDHPQAKRLKLWEYLPRKYKKRRLMGGRKINKSHIPGRISIHDRPAQVGTRKVVGHWESDTMEGKKVDGDGVHVDIERVSRRMFAVKIDSLKAAETIQSQIYNLRDVDATFRKTVTFDNGREFTRHQDLHTLGFNTYFTDKHSPWQKGAVENVIGLIRRYLPKGTSLKTLTQEELDDIVWEINNRPRKILNFNTPHEVYNAFNRGCTSN